MKRRNFILSAGALAATTGIMSGCNTSAGLKKGGILHTVIFDLKYPIGSAEAEKFLTDGYNVLTTVPGVHDFQVFRQCSPKNDYQYGFFMRFINKTDFDTYTAHPDHCKFVKERWDTEVSRFQESDFMSL